MEKHKNCNNCLAIDRYKWTCSLGYRVLGLNRFTPGEPCPKPITQEKFDELSSEKSR